ncbi:hypothetical protein [uncultured Winogradskyella sp.]|uniref:hypothetical protein n=1 Tax=uncultured Winogradskyella sp. TaxID=395353 RepID=UPI00260EC1C3|nr:hypothetical protein [uncultured Winogradskyella sp.]
MSCDSKVNLDLTDKRPVKSIKIGDATEAALIEQELDLEIKHISGNTLYFYSDDQNTLSKLKDIGYQISDENPKQISFRIVKLLSKDRTSLSTENNISISKELSRYNIKTMIREKDHWIIYGALSDLSTIKNMGYMMEDFNSEIFPRMVKITVLSRNDVQIVNKLGVDIHSVEMEGNYPVIYGQAYDYQIDSMRVSEYRVEKINESL